MSSPTQPVFRFAPSPNGALHLGHALSAFLNADRAAESGGRLLLRIEDIDRARCRPDLEAAIRADLAWLGIRFEEPVRRQSEHFPTYQAMLDRLIADDLAYPSVLSRGAVRGIIAEAEAAGRHWPRDPDGVPLHPETERQPARRERDARLEGGNPVAWRLDMRAALDRIGGPLGWFELGAGPAGETGGIPADPAAWGDVVLSRKDAPSSYLLSVVVDDALQGITEVVRGRDLFHSTSVQRLLQALLGFAPPAYRHHRLILGADGRKLSKSAGDTALAALREAGMTPADIRSLVGL